MQEPYNWEDVDWMTRELIYEADNLTDLLTAINARVDVEVPRTTYREWLERYYGEGCSVFDELRAHLAGLDGDLTPLAKLVLKELRKRGKRDRWQSIIVLADRFDRSPSSIRTALKELEGAAYNIVLSDDAKHTTLPTWQEPTCKRIPVEVWMQGDVYRFGVVADTHLCNVKARLDVLNALYDVYEAEGVNVVLHGGNMIDGEFKWNRHELVAFGLENQVAYAAEHYPRREGITTYFITGACHEGWYGKTIGFDVGRYMHYSFADPTRLNRPDLKWLGHIEVDLALHPDNKQSVLRLIHPGGGTAYALSYTMQKTVEAFQGGEKPAVLISGHFHKAGMFYPREIHALQPGCVEDQTSFMRTKRIAAHVGGYMLEIHVTPMGAVGRVKPEFFPFYDKGYYNNWDFGSMFNIANEDAWADRSEAIALAKQTKEE